MEFSNSSSVTIMNSLLGDGRGIGDELGDGNADFLFNSSSDLNLKTGSVLVLFPNLFSPCFVWISLSSDCDSSIITFSSSLPLSLSYSGEQSGVSSTQKSGSLGPGKEKFT